ncbi:MAG: GTPase HflX [Chitinophagaceae bacterium]|nr:MAG: GTPase HflX [Chitinophagaceae bacterium]
MIENQNTEKEKAVLVGLVHQHQTEEQLTEYLDELAFLAETAGAVTKKTFIQKLPHPDKRTFVGKGKLEEIKAYIEKNEIDILIFDDDLNGSQLRNLEREIKCKIIDRSHLILDIFALRARTAQAKTQVELAQLQYLLPRLRGMWSHLERQKGGIGLRGPGEKEIETDRRVVNDKIAKLKEKLSKIDKQNLTRRKQREQMIRVALVGYTNVGKSTIMNALSKSEVFAENKLFATLDTTVRKIVIERMPFLLSDTVGFIRKLPHHLIESFKSTLDEAGESDILIHVADISHPAHEDQIKVVNETLLSLGIKDKTVMMVFNKMDLYEQKNFDEYLNDDIKTEIKENIKTKWDTLNPNQCLFISALSKKDLKKLKNDLYYEVRKLYEERYPYMAEKF